MSAAAVDAVLASDIGPAGVRLVATVLAWRAMDKHDFGVLMGAPTLAKLAGMSAEHAKRCKARLVDLGVIELVRATKGGRGRVNAYRFRHDWLTRNGVPENGDRGERESRQPGSRSPETGIEATPNKRKDPKGSFRKGGGVSRANAPPPQRARARPAPASTTVAAARREQPVLSGVASGGLSKQPAPAASAMPSDVLRAVVMELDQEVRRNLMLTWGAWSGQDSGNLTAWLRTGSPRLTPNQMGKGLAMLRSHGVAMTPQLRRIDESIDPRARDVGSFRAA